MRKIECVDDFRDLQRLISSALFSSFEFKMGYAKAVDWWGADGVCLRGIH
ncbi:MAG: hypothetical protein JOY96_02780 [Verrucomicrobia bacterium]|nr:hypothetical protein [Verrucomicrobiota bacterium]